MGHPPLPPPPQMSNGGSPPAPLPPYLSDPSWWLHFKWSQPPPCTPEWLFDYYKRYNPPANVGRPLRNEECWHQRAIHEDQQAAGLLPPGTPGGPILHGARARADRAYMDWKAAIDDLWADEYEALLVEQAARARQEEAAHRQRLLDKHTVRARQQEEAALNVFFASAPPSNVRGRLHVANASLTSSLLVADASLRHGRRRPPESSSCGSAANTSLPGSLARPRGDCNMRPHSLACNVSKNAVRAWLSLKRSDNRSRRRV